MVSTVGRTKPSPARLLGSARVEESDRVISEDEVIGAIGSQHIPREGATRDDVCDLKSGQEDTRNLAVGRCLDGHPTLVK